MVVMVVFGTRVSETLGGESPRLKLGPRPNIQPECNMNVVSLQPYGKNLDRP